ncbi:unnamed protein product [Paramecium octaurelia]|uniref:TOG domain-containing protein n=1 Tax=Paramecium octaurelia TaxID=43137 RepID=A0A8S1WUC0_PAROT|nr:unnamed protein product [Paramecium octaurelia]
MSLEEFDAFTSLKALRDLKKQIESKAQVDQKSRAALQFIQKAQPLSQYDLRIQFQHWLAKLGDLSTKQIAYTNIFSLVQQNQSQPNLQLLITCLQTPINGKGSESIIKTINIIVGIYGDTITVTDIYKFIEIMLKYFNDSNNNVQMAISECWSNIYIKNISKKPVQQRVLLMYSTLSQLIGSGGSRQTQETATIVLSQLFETLTTAQDLAFIKDVVKDYLGIYLKQQIDHSGFYTIMFYIIKTLQIQSFTSQQIQVIDKTLQGINNQKLNYRTRVGALNLMKLIATQYQNSNFKIALGNLHEQVIVVLEDSTRDRVIAVQNAARTALKEWMRLKLSVDCELIPNPVSLDQSPGFLKKQSGSGGGQVYVNQKIQNQQQFKQDIKQALIEDQFENTVDYSNIVHEPNLNVWQKAMRLQQDGLLEDAVELLLHEGDDLYLIRFLMSYKNYSQLFDLLSNSLALRLIDTLILILESDFLNILCLDFIQQFIDCGLGDWFKDSEFTDYLEYNTEQNLPSTPLCKKVRDQLK